MNRRKKDIMQIKNCFLTIAVFLKLTLTTFRNGIRLMNRRVGSVVPTLNRRSYCSMCDTLYALGFFLNTSVPQLFREVRMEVLRTLFRPSLIQSFFRNLKYVIGTLRQK